MTAELQHACVIPRHGKNRPAAATGLVCGDHLAELRELLADIAGLWDELPWSRLPLAMTGNTGSDGNRTKQPYPPGLINLAALALTDVRATSTAPVPVDVRHNGPRLESNGSDIPNVHAVLTFWCQQVAADRPGAEPLGGTVGLANWLTQHLTWIVGQTWVAAFDDQIRACRRALALAVGEEPGPPATRCPYCGTDCWTDWERDVVRQLRQGSGPGDATGRADRVACTGCGRVWEGASQVRMFALMAEQEDEARKARPA